MDTSSFTDPVFLARFGLSRANVIEYFLHPLNPFRSSANTSNDVLAMQGTTLGLLLQQQHFFPGAGGGPALTPEAAEQEYHTALTRLTGEQYELVPPQDPQFYVQPSPLYTIRHVLRTSPNAVQVLGIYYVVEGVIYKAPSVRSLCKAHVARTLQALAGTAEALRQCTYFLPSVGYMWVFDDAIKSAKSSKSKKSIDKGTPESEADVVRKEGSETKRRKMDEEDEDTAAYLMDPVQLKALAQRRKRRKIVDHRRPGERTPAEEEGIRATEAMDQILVRLSKSPWVTGKQQNRTFHSTAATSTAGTVKTAGGNPE